MSSTSAGADPAMRLPCETQRSIIAGSNLAMVVYVLYCVGYFTAIPGLIGVIIAHLKVDDADPVLRSHYRFQITTFWIGLLYLTIGTLLSIVLIGIPILIWWFLWSLIRIVKGMLQLNDHKPIVRPTSWLFG